MKRLALADLKVPALLVALSLVPVVGGLVRLNSLARGQPAGVDDSRFFAAPLPVLIHVVAASVYALLGAFQFSTGIRRRWPNWHKKLGLVLISCALLTAASGLWMTVAYAIPRSLQGSLLYGVRLVVGAAMLASVVKGWLCIVRRNISGHEAWMIRAYALAQGAGTQALLFLPLMLILGHEVLGFTRDVLMSLAWGINVVVAEWLIRGRAAGAPVHAASASRARALSG